LQSGLTEEAQELKMQANKAIDKLKNYKDLYLTPDNILEYTKLAAQTASRRLFVWTIFNTYYPFPTLEPRTEDEKQEYIQSKAEFYQNYAVLKRNEYLQSKADGNENPQLLREAELMFLDYIDILKRPNSLTNSQRHETIEEEEEEWASIFFKQEVVDANKELYETTQAAKTSNLQIPDIDSGLIRVAGYIDFEDFPMVGDEYEKLRRIVASKHGVTIEEMLQHRLAVFTEILKRARGQS